MTRLVFAPGVFDLLHCGHVNFLSQAAVLGDRLLVGVQEDRAVAEQKGRLPFVPTLDRYMLVRSLRCVDDVVTYQSANLKSLLAHYRPHILAVGPEYGLQPGQSTTLGYCRTHEIDVVVIERTPNVSSTDLRAKIKQFWAECDGPTTLTSFGGDAALIERETEREAAYILQWGHCDRLRLLDLGCGNGRLTNRLADHWHLVVGVDYSESLIHEAQQVGRSRTCFVLGDAETYDAERMYGTVLISGLLPCLDDLQIQSLLDNLFRYTGAGSRILVRTTVATGGRFSVVNQWSEPLQRAYTAYYRTADHHDTIFGDYVVLDRSVLYQTHPDTEIQFVTYERR